MAKRLIQFPTWRDLPYEDARINALQFSSRDSNLLAAACWVQYDHPEVAWFDLCQDAVVDSTFGANRGEDIGTPPTPAVSPDFRFLVRMANEKGGETPCLEFVDRAEANSKKRVRELTAWRYGEYYGDPEGLSHQVFVALAFTPDGDHLLALVGGGDPDDESKHAADIGVYRWAVSAVLKGRGAKSGGRLLPDAGFFLGTEHPDTVGHLPCCLALSPDGTKLAGGYWDTRIPVWDLPSGEATTEIRSKKRNLRLSRRLAFSPDGETLAVADKVVTLHDAATGKPRATLPPGPKICVPWFHVTGSCVLDLAYHPSEPLLATACGDTVVRWWDGVTGKARGRFNWNIGPITAVAFSPDGGLCAAAGDDGRVAIWDVGG